MMTKITQIKKNDRILIFTAILFLILSGILIFQPPSFKFWPKTQSLQIIGKAVLTIDFGNNKRAFEGDIIDNETLVIVLIQASKAGNFSYKLDANNNLTAIDSFSQKNGKLWQWYLNGKKIDKSLNEIIAKDGDNILIKYE